ASSLLRARFPNWPQVIPEQNTTLMPEPAAITVDLGVDTWVEQHPDVQLARAQALYQQANTQQAQTETRPAPTLGLNWANDTSGRERTWTVSVSIPFGGAYRQAATRAAVFDEASAQAHAQQVQQEIQQALDTLRNALSTGFEQWAQENQAYERLQAVVRSQTKGVTLGETAVSDLLVTQRQATQQETELIQRFFQLKSMHWQWLADTANPWKRSATDLEGVK
ncbi:MAG TPA: TolC family protein, partial [Aquabacterium sp.]|nr:TolC family protein [Aquabacterium sp.]